MTARRAATAEVVPPESERSFQAAVLTAARVLGWRTYHTFDARRSAAGFPDIVLVKPPRVVFIELKSERGRLSADQVLWLDVLGQCPNVESYMFRPSSWADVIRVLQGQALT